MNEKSAITSHVLDLSSGLPAAGVSAQLFLLNGKNWQLLGDDQSDDDGRLQRLLPAGEKIKAGSYKLSFATMPYFANKGMQTFYPHIEVIFFVSEGRDHYHVPLLVSPFGYSTYRGS